MRESNKVTFYNRIATHSKGYKMAKNNPPVVSRRASDQPYSHSIQYLTGRKQSQISSPVSRNVTLFAKSGLFASFVIPLSEGVVAFVRASEGATVLLVPRSPKYILTPAAFPQPIRFDPLKELDHIRFALRPSAIGVDGKRERNLGPGPDRRRGIYVQPVTPQRELKPTAKALPLFSRADYSLFVIFLISGLLQRRELRHLMNNAANASHSTRLLWRSVLFGRRVLCFVHNPDQPLYVFRRLGVGNVSLRFSHPIRYQSSKVTFLCRNRQLTVSQNTRLLLTTQRYGAYTSQRKERKAVVVAVTERICWRLKELPAATGLTLAFWRKVVRLKKIPTRKLGSATVILDSDLRKFIEGRQEGN